MNQFPFPLIFFVELFPLTDLVDQSDPTDLEGPEHLGKEPLHHGLNKVVGVGVADHYKEGVQVLEFRIILTGSKLCGKN